MPKIVIDIDPKTMQCHVAYEGYQPIEAAMILSQVVPSLINQQIQGSTAPGSIVQPPQGFRLPGTRKN